MSLACEQQQASVSNRTKCCACLDKWFSGWLITYETSCTMRGRSEHDRRMKPSVRNPPRNQGYFSRPPRVFSWKIQHLAPGLWFKAAPATKNDTPTSPNTAPAMERLWHWTISITRRFCYVTLLLLRHDKSITWQFYSLLCDVVRTSEVSYVNFLWQFITVYCLLYLTKTMLDSIVLLLSTLITCKMCVIDLDILYHTCSIVVCAHKNGVFQGAKYGSPVLASPQRRGWHRSNHCRSHRNPSKFCQSRETGRHLFFGTSIPI